VTLPDASAATARATAPLEPSAVSPVEAVDATDPTPEIVGRRFFTWRTGISFLFGVAILVWVVRSSALDPAEVVVKLTNVELSWYALAICSYLTTFPFRGLRWQRLLIDNGTRLPMRPLIEVIFLSWFVNSVMPGKVGDVYRAYLLRGEFRLSLSRTVGTVLAERIADIFTLVSVLGVSGAIVLGDHVDPRISRILEFGWAGVLVLFAGLLVMYRYGGVITRVFPERIREPYDRFAAGTFASFGHPHVLALLTALAWASEAGRLYCVVRSLGVAITPVESLFTVAAISLALIIPTPGGLGGVEAAFIGVLPLFGVPAQVAIVVAFLDRLISYYGIIAIGLPAFVLTRRGVAASERHA
jgi:uncharacterized protein (TIRG00374 family)